MNHIRSCEESSLESPFTEVVGTGTQSLLWLHGFMGSSCEFQRFASRLTDTHRSLLVDLPGHGGAPLTSVVSYESWSSLLLRILDSQGVEATDIVGYSMGGRLALYFSLMHPDRVRRVVLESTSPGLRDTRERRKREIADATRAELLKAGPIDSFVTSWYRSHLFSNLKHKPDIMRELVRTRAANDRVALAQVLTQLSPGRQPSMWRLLPTLTVPALLLAGSEDGKYLNLSRKTRNASGRIRLRTIKGAGHNIHLESPKAYLDAIRRFLLYRLETKNPNLK